VKENGREQGLTDTEFSLNRILFKNKPPHNESEHILVMTAAVSRKTRLHAIMISRCHGDDIFLSPFTQTNGNSPFLEKREKTFTAPLFFLIPRPPPPTQSSLVPVLHWRPVLSRLCPRVQRSNKKYEKIEGLSS